MASLSDRIWDQTRHRQIGQRQQYATPTRGGMLPDGSYVTADNAAVINPNYYGGNDPMAQIRAFQKNQQITGRTPLEAEAIKQFGGAQVSNMPQVVQQAIADQDYAVASYSGGQGTPLSIRNPYTNDQLTREEQDAVATAIDAAQKSAAPGLGVPASPRVAADVTAFMSGLEYRTEAQNRSLEEQLTKKHGAQLDMLPAWRGYKAESKAQFEETARRSAHELLSTDPNMPQSVVAIDPKTGQAGVDPDRYRVYQNAQKQQLDSRKQKMEQAKSLIEYLQTAQTAQEDQSWWSGSGEFNAAMDQAKMQARIMDAVTGDDTFSSALMGSASPTDMMTKVLQQLNAPAPVQAQQTQPAESNAPSPEVMAGMADMAQSRVQPGKTVGTPLGEMTIQRSTPFTGGQFSVPDEKPQGLVIEPNASQVKRNVYAHNASFAGKKYSIPPHIKAALEENPSLAEIVLPQFEKKPVATKPAQKSNSNRAGKTPQKKAAKAKPTIEWQGKTYEVSEVMAEAAKKNPELTQYFIGAK